MATQNGEVQSSKQKLIYFNFNNFDSFSFLVFPTFNIFFVGDWVAASQAVSHNLIFIPAITITLNKRHKYYQIYNLLVTSLHQKRKGALFVSKVSLNNFHWNFPFNPLWISQRRVRMDWILYKFSMKSKNKNDNDWKTPEIYYIVLLIFLFGGVLYLYLVLLIYSMSSSSSRSTCLSCMHLYFFQPCNLLHNNNEFSCCFHCSNSSWEGFLNTSLLSSFNFIFFVSSYISKTLSEITTTLSLLANA